jgi:hypothetical protein
MRSESPRRAAAWSSSPHRVHRAPLNATPAFGNQGTGRRLECLRHPLTLVRAALGPDAKLSNSRTEGKREF